MDLQAFLIYIFLGFLTLYVDSRIVFDIYHDKIFSKNVEKPNQTYEDVELFKYLNTQYYSLIRVGKPSKEFKVIFDTSWADSWLPSQQCEASELACMIHNRYDHRHSSTYKPNDTKYSMNDKEGSLEGFLSIDDFYLPHMKVANQTFIEMTKMSLNPYFFQKADGIIGLAFSSIAVNGSLPFMYNMIKQGLIEKNIFTFYMNSHLNTEKAGRLIIGGTDRSHIHTNLTYLPVRDKRYWTIQMDKFLLDSHGKSDYLFCDQGCQAIIDTSVSGITGPPDIISRINIIIGARKLGPDSFFQYVLDCRSTSTLPSITFVLGGKNFTIISKNYVQYFTYYSLTICLSPFMPNVFDGIWQLGGTFLMQFYAEFDLDQSRVGIAPVVF